jgi:hypothetical protein
VFFIYITYGLELQSIDGVKPLPLGYKDHNSVLFQKFVYYNFTVKAHKGFTLTVEHQLGTTKNHDIDVYVRKGGALPDRIQFDYFDINVKNTIVIDGMSEPVDTIYIAGIYGFTGTETLFTILYEETNGCPQNCNGAGLCRRDNACSCFTGHVGPYCQYNATAVTLGQTYSGPIQANHWVYYSVDVFAANNLEIHATQSGGDVDLYLKYQTIPDFINYEYVEISTKPEFTLTVTEPLLGTWYIGLYAFLDATYTFTVSEQRSCPMNCSLHGSCIGSVCHCVSGYTGASCEEATTNLNTTSPTHGYVSLNFWNFYQYVANSDNPFLVRVAQKDATANCDVYIMNGGKPTRFIYQYTNVTLLPTTEILVQHPGLDVWWIGVYGTSNCEYDISVFPSQVISICGNCGSHGRCNENNICVCDDGWFGIECDKKPEVLLSGQRSATIAVGNREWRYYSISFTDSSLLTVVLNEKVTSGLVWVYLAKETYPTLDAYEAGDNAVIANHRISLEFSTPKSHRIVIGVYGSPYIVTPVSYSLVAFSTPF